MTDSPGAPAAGTPRARPAMVRWLETTELIIGVALLAMIFTLTLVQATQRHLPVDGWVWTGELARLGLVWLTFALAGYLMGRDGHITVQVVDLLTRGRGLRAVWILANLVVAVVCAAFTIEAAHLVFSGSPQRTPALGIPQAWTYAVPLLGLALTALRAVANAFTPGPPSGASVPWEEPAR